MRSETRIVKQAYRFELDPNQAQRVLLAKSVGASRYVYNWGLAESKRQYDLTGKRPRLGDLKKQLVELKNTDAPWLYQVSAHIGQSALKDLNHAFERFFRSVKGDGPKAGYPRFKRKGERDSARLYEVTLEDRHLRMHKIGRVRLKETSTQRGFEGRILSATITRRADRWFVSLAVERKREIVLPRLDVKPRDVVGVDLGLANAAVIHDGATTRLIEPQRALRKNLKKLRRLDRQLARKQRGSASRQKSKLRRARLLAYKSEWYGSRLVVANRFFPSSKLCSNCGTIKDTLSLSERVYCCTVCGLSLDRDENAAINLRRLGLAQLPVDRREVTPVERKALASASAEVKPASMKQEETADGALALFDSQKHAKRRAGAEFELGFNIPTRIRTSDRE